MRLALCLALAAAPAAAEPRFADRAGSLPVAHVYSGGWEHFVGGGVAVFDCDGDARPEILAAGGAGPMRLFRNRTPAPGAALEFDLAAFPAITETTGAYPLDIDGDGWLDLAVLRVGPDLVLTGGPDCAFADATADWGLAPRDGWTTAFTATWEAGQARPTLVFGHYVDRADPDGPFEACDSHDIYRPEGAGYGTAEVIEPGYCALSMLISDWRRRGEPELRVSNDRHYYVRGGYEQMFRLSPLRERVEDWPRVSLWGMGIASQDITGDGLPEVMMTSMGDQLLQINTGTGFINAPYAIGTYAQRPHIGDDGRPATGWHVAFGDTDNDGRDDIFIAKGNVDQMPTNAIHDPNNLLWQAPDGTFREVSVAAGVATTERARGAALADLDGDGRLDLVVVNRRAALELWQNMTDPAGHWAGIEPVLPPPNTRAVGAWVELRAGGRVTAREVTVGGGHAGGTALPLHFGLADHAGAEARVIWPDGTETGWLPVPAGRVTRIGAGGVVE